MTTRPSRATPFELIDKTLRPATRWTAVDGVLTWRAGEPDRLSGAANRDADVGSLGPKRARSGAGEGARFSGIDVRGVRDRWSINRTRILGQRKPRGPRRAMTSRSGSPSDHEGYQRPRSDTRIVRISTPPGRERPRDGTRVPNSRQALSNEPLTIYGDGSQTRSFATDTTRWRGVPSVQRGTAATPHRKPGEYT